MLKSEQCIILRVIGEGYICIIGYVCDQLPIKLHKKNIPLSINQCKTKHAV